MNWVALLVLAAAAIVTAVAGYQLKQINRDLRQARLLYEQMEEDHGMLVKLYLETRNKLAEPTKTPKVNQ